ncbi:MAG: glutathione S-transferase family protein [Geminicoccales bacterium]
MTEIILHHYPQSPVAEKVRVGLGIKNLAWRSVEIPRLPPKPLLMPLTGGYRRTPVMQIGADIYCDTQCILRELQRRYPEPTFYPGGGDGMVWGISRWTDSLLLDLVVKVVLGASPDDLPPAFAADRGRLYFGPDYDLAAVNADLDHTLAQLRAQFGWIDQRLATGRTFLLGDQPGLPDALTYYLVWFLHGRWAEGPNFIAAFPSLQSWQRRIAAIGHGETKDLSAEDALDIAAKSEPTTPRHDDPGDRQGLTPGITVDVRPMEDGGDPPVTGEIRYIDAETIALHRTEERLGSLVVHFPRVGYRISRT